MPPARRLITCSSYFASLPERGTWQDRAGELRRTGAMAPRVDEEFVLYADDTRMVKGNTQGSAGYFYVCAHFPPSA